MKSARRKNPQCPKNPKSWELAEKAIDEDGNPNKSIITQLTVTQLKRNGVLRTEKSDKSKGKEIVHFLSGNLFGSIDRLQLENHLYKIKETNNHGIHQDNTIKNYYFSFKESFNKRLELKKEGFIYPKRGEIIDLFLRGKEIKMEIVNISIKNPRITTFLVCGRLLIN